MRILVVEDEKRIADFLCRGLQGAGYAVDAAPTGAAAKGMPLNVRTRLSPLTTPCTTPLAVRASTVRSCCWAGSADAPGMMTNRTTDFHLADRITLLLCRAVPLDRAGSPDPAKPHLRVGLQLRGAARHISANRALFVTQHTSIDARDTVRRQTRPWPTLN